jgi:hypothetical protein
MRTIGNTFEAEGAKSGKKLRADWVTEAQGLGIEIPPKATVDDIKELIAAASAKNEDAADSGPKDDEGTDGNPEKDE